jgi:hypothetical protein
VPLRLLVLPVVLAVPVAQVHRAVARTMPTLQALVVQLVRLLAEPVAQVQVEPVVPVERLTAALAQALASASEPVSASEPAWVATAVMVAQRPVALPRLAMPMAVPAQAVKASAAHGPVMAPAAMPLADLPGAATAAMAAMAATPGAVPVAPAVLAASGLQEMVMTASSTVFPKRMPMLPSI